MQSKNDANTSQFTRTQQARRHDILLAAIAVINNGGYAAASVEKIAEHAGTTKSTVLYHFKSKEAINSALVAMVFEEGATYMTPYILSAKNSREKLQNYLIANLRFIAEHSAQVAAVQQIAQNIDKKEFATSSDLIENDAPVVWLKNMLEEGKKTGEFGQFDSYVIAVSIRLIIDSAPSYILVHPSIDVEHYISELVQLFDKATSIK
ncbi:MAG TPA: TetR/AcrR family transcriptional regulator [Candidatus Saccharimonadales bacterium]|nr:TetR/AcrR family transcriptional regulator [Candidatus Saccharimonadales bacterium]